MMPSKQNQDALSSAWYDALRRKPYMPGWIKDAAEAMRSETRRRELFEKANKAAEESLAANGPALFQILYANVKSDVEELNEMFPEAMKRLSIESVGSSCFQVVRKYAPDFLLIVTLMGNNIFVSWEITQNGMKHSDVFGMEHNVSGGVLTENGNPIMFGDASRKLLEPALRGLL